MLNIISHEGNENQTHEISSHTHQDGYCQNKITVDKDVEKLEPLCTADGKVKWNICYGKECSSSSRN